MFEKISLTIFATAVAYGLFHCAGGLTLEQALHSAADLAGRF